MRVLLLHTKTNMGFVTLADRFTLHYHLCRNDLSCSSCHKPLSKDTRDSESEDSLRLLHILVGEEINTYIGSCVIALDGKLLSVLCAKCTLELLEKRREEFFQSLFDSDRVRPIT